MAYKNTIQYFWAKVRKGDGCWEWTGRRLPAGYGAFCFRGQAVYAHRLSFELATGREIGRGNLICHRCDNPPCVRPDHLFEGTYRDNVADMIAKGRRVQPVQLTRPLAERFAEKVDRLAGHGPDGECWLWTGARFSNGYGGFWMPQRKVPYAHLVAYALSRGVDVCAVTAKVRQTCGVRLCVNPRHLLAESP